MFGDIGHGMVLIISGILGAGLFIGFMIVLDYNRLKEFKISLSESIFGKKIGDIKEVVRGKRFSNGKI